jgi:hypothetical protein
MSFMNNNKPILKRISSNRMKSGYSDFNYYATIEDYQNAFNKFKDENGRFPSTIDMDNSEYLPTSRTILRKFGSIKVLREMIGLEGLELDMRTGEQKRSLLSILNDNGMKSENILYEELLKHYEPMQIHRQEPYTDMIKNLSRSDFGIYDGDRHFYIDTFVPRHLQSLIGCANLKLNKFKKYNIDAEIYLVIANTEMNEAWFERKEMEAYRAKDLIKKFPPNVKIITFEKCLELIAKKFND